MWAGPCCISSHAGLDRHLLQLGLPHLLPKSGNLETKTAGFRTGGRVNDGRPRPRFQFGDLWRISAYQIIFVDLYWHSDDSILILFVHVCSVFWQGDCFAKALQLDRQDLHGCIRTTVTVPKAWFVQLIPSKQH